jgi:hypothetical protein
LAGLVRRVQDLVVEDREVQGKSKTDWVGRRKLGAGDLSSSLVCLEGLVGGRVALVARGKLGEVAVVVSLPMNAGLSALPAIASPDLF